MLDLFMVNCKYTGTTSLNTFFTLCSGVFIVNFEQVNDVWGKIVKLQVMYKICAKYTEIPHWLASPTVDPFVCQPCVLQFNNVANIFTRNFGNFFQKHCRGYPDADVHPELQHTSKTERFATRVSGFSPLIILINFSIFDAGGIPGYACPDGCFSELLVC